MSTKRKASKPVRRLNLDGDDELLIRDTSQKREENNGSFFPESNGLDSGDGDKIESDVDDGNFVAEKKKKKQKRTIKRKNQATQLKVKSQHVIPGDPLYHIGAVPVSTTSSSETFKGFVSMSFDGEDNNLIGSGRQGDVTVKAVLKDTCDSVVDSLRFLVQKGMLVLRARCLSSSSEINENSSPVIEVSAVLTTRAFEDAPRDADDASERQHHSHLRAVIEFFCQLSPLLPPNLNSNVNGQQTMNLHTLYEEICPPADSPLLDRVPAELLPTLRRYQLQAVQWMLNRELHPAEEEDHPLWTPIAVQNSNDMKPATFYLNRLTGRVSRENSFRGTSVDSDLPGTLRGGILADEMGLGKTLEVLALILAHRKEKHEDEMRMNTVARGEDEDYAPEKVERVDCVCGRNEENEDAQWICCDSCNRWMHLRCVPSVANPDLPFDCDRCLEFVGSELIEVGATLIVCPASILQQWKTEISRHTKPKSLRLMIYEGVRSNRSSTLIRPQTFEQFDIVLTTYETLRSEVHHVLENVEQRKFRQEKRYRPVPTPLTRCLWWRVCLDECQMVESPTAKTAEMARQLNSVYRWSVSGTPIERGLEDLQGLCVFLGIRPYYKRTWWTRLLQEPFEKGHREPLIRFLKALMWRNTKKSVGDQLGLPQQTEHLLHLNFSPVEAFFYRKTHQECLTKASDQLHRVSSNASRMTEMQKASKVLGPILQLRQACCHPQIGSKAVRSLNQNPMTMAELLDNLIQRAKVEAQEAHRGLLCSLNGLAAVEIINGAIEKAIARYEEAQQMIATNELHFSSDKLQRIHCLYNLAELLSRPELNVENRYGARVAALKEQELNLRKQYTGDCTARTLTAESKWKTIESNVQSVLSNEDSMGWMHFLILKARENNSLSSEVMQLATDALSYSRDSLSGAPAGRSLKRFNTVDGLSVVVMNEWEQLIASRDALVQRMKNVLCAPITPNDVYVSGNCRICRSHLKKTGMICKHCASQDLFDDYQSKLFRRISKLREQDSAAIENEVTAEELGLPLDDDALAEQEHAKFKETRQKATRESTFADSELLRLLKLLRGLVQRRFGDEIPLEYRDIVEKFDKFLENMKKEYLSLSSLWRSQTNELSALDELDMTTMRIRLAYPGEKVADDERHYKLQPEDVAATAMKLEHDKMQFGGSLTHALTQLSYLKQLKQQNAPEAENAAATNSPCPVCQEIIGPNKVVLLCGHMFCSDCIIGVLKHSHSKTNLKCPSCRQLIPQEEISYIVDYGPRVPSPESDQSNIPVKGSYGTKIEGVVRCLKRIAALDSSAKSIVFSEWKDVLEITAHALRENEIDFVQVKDRSDFDKKLHLFKNNSTVKVLLLSTKNGANGLNLTEATNVLLIAPMLTPAVEDQAVNRIHRIGQTKPTSVYRFLVSHSIEEKVYDFGREKSRQSQHQQKKKKQNDISIDELQQLITTTIESAKLPASAALGSDPSPPSDIDTELRFWNTKVWYREQWMPRHRAVFLIECEYSWDCKSRGVSITDEPTADVMGRVLASGVASKLLDLRAEDTPPDAANNANIVDES